jgi:hypothetical protein
MIVLRRAAATRVGNAKNLAKCSDMFPERFNRRVFGARHGS